ncbi:hypothetical protein Taro_055394, partial [Colocasia esculenta]|nr:hypothetical protein [Colocasia esculenta]
MVMMVTEEETRKGPWTEQEDTQLVFFVGLFGDRRWDAIARASGLQRTGKSCRLRWVNYLRPGLKRGRMTPQEEGLILELHSRWGNRWSRIARKLPGRTDNEIKNYWRTHTRKKAQDRKRGSSPELSTSSSSSSLLDESQLVDAAAEDAEPHAAGRVGFGSPRGTAWEEHEQMAACGGFPMEQIWNEIASSEMSGLTCYGGNRRPTPNDWHSASGDRQLDSGGPVVGGRWPVPDTPTVCARCPAVNTQCQSVSNDQRSSPDGSQRPPGRSTFGTHLGDQDLTPDDRQLASDGRADRRPLDRRALNADRRPSGVRHRPPDRWVLTIGPSCANYQTSNHWELGIDRQAPNTGRASHLMGHRPPTVRHKESVFVSWIV